jgi:hypothetical protein
VPASIDAGWWFSSGAAIRDHGAWPYLLRSHDDPGRLSRTVTPRNAMKHQRRRRKSGHLGISPVQAHIPRMAKTAPVQFTVRPLKDGSAYLVIYSPHQGGMEQQISGFASESEAKDWIANKSANWLTRLKGQK